MKFSELVNIDELRGLCESYTANTGAATALLELDGAILIATGWQDICTRFHRVNETTACRCKESDTILAGGLDKGQLYNIYKCKNGLIDVAVPIMIRSQHVANFFTGQFFFEAPDKEYFTRQAEEFVFDKASYLEALQRVPIFSEETIKAMMQFFTRLAQLIGEMGLARMELEEKNQELTKIITERKQAEDALRSSEAKFRTLAEYAPVGIYMTDPAGNCIFTNSYWQMISGLSAEEAAGKGWEKALHPEDRNLVAEKWYQSVQSRGQWGYEYRFLAPQGKLTWVYGTAFPLMDSDSQVTGYIGTNTDITELKRFEEEKRTIERQLQQTQKLESLGVLAGGIAHDFNKILSIIMGNCSLAGMYYESAGDYIPVIEKAAERAAGLCRQMMAYAGKAPFSRDMVVMWLLVDDVVNMLKVTIRQNVVIKTKYSPDIPSIMGDAGQLRQIVMNLVINAAEAIGEAQGEVCVSLTKADINAGSSRDHLGTVIPAGRHLCLEVTDNGFGMDDETRRRIFEPFYTTKFTGRGLGMSAVLGILKAHNGALQLSSQSGHGTTFKVYLPAQTSETTRGENQIESTPPVLWQGSGTILLVEDEEQIRGIAKNFLETFGFSVLEAVNGKEALDTYHKNAAEITLVLTAMGMPIMDGYELFAELKKLNSQLPIIVSSGYGDAEVSARIGSDNIAGIISKPYNPSQLREVLKRVINGSH